MQVEKVSIDILKEWEENPRDVKAKDLERLKKQITELGQYKALLVNQDNIVLGGNMRLRAMKELGIKEVWVSRVRTKDKEEMVKYALSDNDRVGYYVKADLKELIEDLDIEVGDYKVDIGQPVSLDTFVEIETKNEDEPLVKEDIEVVSKYGEVYQLGRHRLMCGDSTKKEDVEILMGDKLADMVFTDPPYMVNYRSPSRNSYDTGKYEHEGVFSDGLDEEQREEFYREVATRAFEFTKEQGVIYWWYANSNVIANRKAIEEAGFRYIQTIIWVKDNLVLSREYLYHRVYEPCIVGMKGKFEVGRLKNVKDTFSLSRDDIADMVDVWYVNRDKVTEYVHPTQKPIGLAVRAMRVSSNEGDIVLDLFGGSGSTMEACERFNRVSYTMELDPYYCDVIRKRYAQLVGAVDWTEATPIVEKK